MIAPIALLLSVMLWPGQRSERLAAAEIKAEKVIPRLPPSAFPLLPPKLSAYLKRRGCTIPQSGYLDKRHNVIRGEFMVRGRKDWAVLCSRRGASAIFVFRPGGVAPVAELAPAEDRHYLQGRGDGIPEFSRSISPAPPHRIRSYQREFGGPLPRRLDHEGIDNSFDGKASIVLYFHQGRWIELTGMD